MTHVNNTKKGSIFLLPFFSSEVEYKINNFNSSIFVKYQTKMINANHISINFLTHLSEI